MQTNQDYINYYEKVVNTQNYSIIQTYFKNNECVNHKIVGHMTYLCRQSKAKDFLEWVKYYSCTPYAKNLSIAVKALQEKEKELGSKKAAKRYCMDYLGHGRNRSDLQSVYLHKIE